MKDDVFSARRAALLAQFTSDDILVLPAAKELLRTPEIEYPYRQDCNVLYLTNYPETDSIVVLLPGRKDGEFVLFNLPKDPEKEVWTGTRIGQANAVTAYHADQAFSIDEISARLPELLHGRKRVHFPFYNSRQPDADKKVLLFKEEYLLNFFRRLDLPAFDILPKLSEMRLLKAPDELACMQEAIRISGIGHMSAMRHCRPGMFEYQLDARLQQSFYDNGSRSPAYPNVVGSGPSACILHYEANNRRIENGDLVLIDAGAEYKGYAADITRTFPANGRFSSDQKKIYNLVLKAQAAGIEATKPGVTWRDIRDLVARVITEGLVELGILKGGVEQFYMHGPGHWIGLDTHDVGSKDKDGNVEARPFEPGMVLTMEPGIYISDKHKDVDPKWHNMAVRIEDMLLVTEEGCKVLSAAIPKSIMAVEAIMEQERKSRLLSAQSFMRHHDRPLADEVLADDRALLRRSC